MDGYAIATLAIFILSIGFIIHPVSIPTHVRSIPYVHLNLSTAPILAIAILWASQCINPDVIRDGIVGTGGAKPCNFLILSLSLAYMAITLDTTGILEATAVWTSKKGGSNERKSCGNDPVILFGMAFLAYTSARVEPMPWLMSDFAAANTASMVLFVGNPINVVICEGFSVNNAAFTAYTILPFIACNIACLRALAGQYHNNIPRILNETAETAPGWVVYDTASAWTSNTLVGTVLVICSVVSVFGRSTWEIGLTFGFAKFIFDLVSDHRRFTHGMAPDFGEGSMMETPNHEPQIQQSLGSTSSEYQFPALSAELSTSRPNSEDALQTTWKSLALRPFLSSSSLVLHTSLRSRFPTSFTVLPRLPFALVPFAFSQSVLIQALAHQGWVNVFADWLVKATNKDMCATIWLVGILGVILCSATGTNIGAVMLLTKVVNVAALPSHSARAAAIALAIASNIGAVTFTSASSTGLWKDVLSQKQLSVRKWYSSYWNCSPLLLMTLVGLTTVCAEMAVLHYWSAT